MLVQARADMCRSEICKLKRKNEKKKWFVKDFRVLQWLTRPILTTSMSFVDIKWSFWLRNRTGAAISSAAPLSNGIPAGSVACFIFLRRTFRSWVAGRICWIWVRWSPRWCWSEAAMRCDKAARRHSVATGTQCRPQRPATTKRRTPATTSEWPFSPCHSVDSMDKVSVGHFSIEKLHLKWKDFEKLS